MNEVHVPIDVQLQRMANMRRQGHTFQQIGDEFSISKQGAWLRLDKYHPGMKPGGVSEKKVALLVGCSSSYLRELRDRGVLSPLRVGWIFRYDRGEIEKAMLAVQRVCSHCGASFPSGGSAKYCLVCRAKRKRYNYSFFSAESKKRHFEQCKRWRKEHPEQAKVIQQRAMKRYVERQRMKVEVGSVS